MDMFILNKVSVKNIEVCSVMQLQVWHQLLSQMTCYGSIKLILGT
jgi:hypothetical protein